MRSLRFRWFASRPPSGSVKRNWRLETLDLLGLTLFLAAWLGVEAILFGVFTRHVDVLAVAAESAVATLLATLRLVSRLRAMMRLRRHGQLADAKITGLRAIEFDQELPDVGINRRVKVTTVRLSFSDASGNQISGQYRRPSAVLPQEQIGRVIRIVYDPRHPRRFSPVEGDYRNADLKRHTWAVAILLIVTTYLLLRAFI